MRVRDVVAWAAFILMIGTATVIAWATWILCTGNLP